jgi:hypothetical protein
MSRKDGGWLLPAVIDPPRTSVCVPVPDDPDHRRAFVGALYQLTYWWNWQRDDDKRGREVARVWLDIWHEVTEKLDALEGCEADEGGEDMTAIEDMLRDIKAEIRLIAWDGSVPSSINPDAPDQLFDRDVDNASVDEVTNRQAALCHAVRRYVFDTMYQYHLRAAALAGVVGVPAALAFLLGGPIGFVSGAVALVIASVAYDDVFDAASDEEALESIVCDLYSALKGKNNTQANFIAALDGLDDGTGNRATAVQAIKQFRSKTENYLFFQDALGAGYSAALAGAENDCCVDEPQCEDWVDFREGLRLGMLLQGTQVPGQGLQTSYVVGNRRYAKWEVTWETPCTIGPSGGARIWVKAFADLGPQNPGGQFWGYDADLEEWVAWGGNHTFPTGDGWWEIKSGPSSVTNITGLRYQFWQAASLPLDRNQLRGIWWGADVSGAPPF